VLVQEHLRRCASLMRQVFSERALPSNRVVALADAGEQQQSGII
jgi:hypothetical protein